MTDGTTRVEDEDIVTTWREDAKAPDPRRRPPWPTLRTPTGPMATAPTAPTGTHRRHRRRQRRRRRRRHRRHRWRQRRPVGSPAIGRCAGDPAAFVRDHWPRPCCAAGRAPTCSTTCFAGRRRPHPGDHLAQTPSFRLVKDASRCRRRPTPASGRMGSGRWPTWPTRPDLRAVPWRRHHRAPEPAALLGAADRFSASWSCSSPTSVQVNAYLTPPAASRARRPSRHPRRVRPPGPRPQAVAGLGRGRAVPPRPPEGAAPRRVARRGPLVDAELVGGDCLYVPRGFRHAARTTETASLHLTVGMPPATGTTCCARWSSWPPRRNGSEGLPVGMPPTWPP